MTTMAAEAVEPVTEETLEFPAVRVDKKFVIQQQGKDHVLFSGLIDALHQLSLGFFSVDTRIEQLPTGENGQQAVCSACVRVYDPDNPDLIRRSVTGLGDASPANVSRMMVNALIRMAETRAKARALRDLLNVGMVAFEELGPQAADEPPEGPVERIMIEGRAYTRPQVEAAYRQRVEQAKAAGIANGEVAIVPIERTPLAVLAGKSQELRRRLEAKVSPAGGAGK
jgi:hypothetical protein